MNQITHWNCSNSRNRDVATLASSKRRGKNADKQVVGLSLTLESRRDMAKRLQLPTKSSALDEQILATSNRIKEIGIGEALKMAASPEWTGARVAVTRNKAGVKRFTLALMSVADKRTVTREQLSTLAECKTRLAERKGQKAIEA